MNTLRARFNLSEREQVADCSASEFGNVTSIHGLRYVLNRHDSLLTKSIWIVWLVVSFLLCTIMLANVCSRWYSDPLIVSLTDKPEPIWEIPFPAITICPETKSKQSVFNFTKFYNTLLDAKIRGEDPNFDEHKTTMQAVAQVCDSHLTTQILTGPSYTNSSIFDILRKLAPDFNETAYFCKFQDELAQCHRFFSEVWTDEGLCFTFNLLNGNDITSELVDQPKYPLVKRLTPSLYKNRIWTLAKGYEHSKEPDPTVYPYQILGAGGRGAFTIVLRLFENDFDYVCRGPIIGYKIAVHLPGDLPQISNHFIRVSPKQETLITFDPRVTRTAESLHDYSPTARGCFYPNEGTLKYFKEYTQRNCELECQTDHTLRNCGCVKFYMPRDDATPICGYQKFQCVVESGRSILGEKFHNVTSGGKDTCNCLPACTQITYTHEVSQAGLDFPKLIQAFGDPIPGDYNPNAIFARLTIQAKENHFMAIRRHELYSHSDLLALCGGILALFFGASLFSIAELIYYLTRCLRWKKSMSIERSILNDDVDNDSTHVIG